MESQWYKLKNQAIALRRKGMSVRYVESKLHIPRSTLSGWFKDVKLTEKQQEKLFQDWESGLVQARKKAVVWHNQQRISRQQAIRTEVEDFFSDVIIDTKVAELILATFYLAEGGKTEDTFVLANSNALMLKGMVYLMRRLYKIDESKLRCTLHLRKDQDDARLKDYWSTLLKVPKQKFLKTQFDKRAIKKTHDYYKGVCVINYYDLALQRRILYLGEKILDTINNKGG
jgi:hypothetical protein